jgi:hypothetical protein
MIAERSARRKRALKGRAEPDGHLTGDDAVVMKRPVPRA